MRFSGHVSISTCSICVARKVCVFTARGWETCSIVL